MINTINHHVTDNNGVQHHVIIEPVLHQLTYNQLMDTGLYKLYKGGDEAETTIFEVQPIAPEIGENVQPLDDNKNPDYLGQIRFTGDSDWHYSEGFLSVYEQEQLVEFIRSANS